MKLEGPGERLTIFIGETDQHQHKPLYTEIVHRAHAAGLAGATVLRGLEGYGASRHIHTTRILSLSEDLPVIVVIVDKLGTLTVNLTGSLALGFLIGFDVYRGLEHSTLTVVGVGFLGAYTTFSTFAYETVRLIEDGSVLEAVGNAAASTVLGLAAAGAGIALAGL
jgi:protein CrcB